MTLRPSSSAKAYALLEDLADATIDGSRKERLLDLQTVPLLIIDDLGMRKLPATAAEDLLEVVRRRHERASTLMTSNRPVEDWGKLLGDTPAVAAMLDRLLHHGHVPRMRASKLENQERLGLLGSLAAEAHSGAGLPAAPAEAVRARASSKRSVRRSSMTTQPFMPAIPIPIPSRLDQGGHLPGPRIPGLTCPPSSYQ